ncbi:hypothetical protein C440_05652 [Haloferax mucosum ATCC BAA-1512]|uniref:Uncharacterized protein n=1 Tax=Haloferax mucosum ATCC BAA-1512 TaxID=662479 RepID=M0IH07_9EURY|nr:hypothetical protein [Haloferax mucosum]ELZ96050.1 hypothetical protein C440_05652 [Haloferax mucosum ATCC BAA-1512]
MRIFSNSSSSADKARAVLDDLPEGSSPFEILQAVDQKAGDGDVDPDEVVQELRAMSDEVDQKLANIDGAGVDQKEMRDAAGAVASRTSLSTEDAMTVLSATVNASEQKDASALVDAFDSVHGSDTDQKAGDGNAQETDADADTTTDTTQMSDNPTDDGTEIDQKQTDGDMNPLDLVEQVGDSDARSLVEDYAESMNKDVEEVAAEWIAENVPGVTVEGYGSDGGDGAGADAPAADQNGGQAQPPAATQNVDQMLQSAEFNEHVAAAITNDKVLDEMAGALGQKMAEDDEFADQLVQKMTESDDLSDKLVQTVDQKGDFISTGQTTATAPSGEAETVGASGALTGGDGE